MALRFYLSLFLRRLHWFVLVVVLSSSAGLILAKMLPSTYEATARLVVESEQIPDALAASTVQTQATEELQIIQQRILTRDILVEMANRLDIYADRRAAGKPPYDAEAIVDDLRDRISISVNSAAPNQNPRRGEPQATIVTVSFSAPTATLAAAVTNEVVTLILKENVSMRTGVARETLEFFEQEVTRLDKALAQQAAEILAFKEGNLNALPENLDFLHGQQAAAQERMLQLSRQEAELVDKRERMIRLNNAASSANGEATGGDRTPEAQQLQQALDQRAQLLAVLSPENPKVKLVEQQIAALKKIVDAQATGSAVGADGKPMTAFDMELADVDGQLAYLADQKKQVQSDIDALNTSIKATPGNAIALETLEREYSALKNQYARAVDNKAKAETGDAIEALSKGQRISVIEQAIAPSEPTSPNRPLIAAAGIGIGLVMGLGVVALTEVLKPGVRSPADLTNGLGITPFATLPYLHTRREILWQRLTILGGVAAVLIAVAIGLWAINTYYMPLDLLMQRAANKVG